MSKYSTSLEERVRHLEEELKTLDDKVEDISQQWKDLEDLENIIFGTSVYNGYDGLIKRVSELESKMEVQ